MPARAWELMAGDDRDQEVAITIAALDLASAKVATSEPVRLSFSPAALDAGLYYFSQGRSGIVRALIGAGAQTLVPPGTAANRLACAGCHTVSRDGHTIAFTATTAVETKLGSVTVERVDDPTKPLVFPPELPGSDAATMALNPDGTLVLVSGVGGGGQVVVRETATGREVPLDRAALGGGKLYFPEWSPDGREIVATLATREENAYTVNDGSIVALTYEGGRFGPVRVLVAGDASTSFHFYPSWSPDGGWIVFASAPAPGRSYDNPQARLRLVSRTGEGPFELTRAMNGKGASWPKFAPITQRQGNLLYLTFASKLDYGYFLRNGPDPTVGRSQLWLATIDLSKLTTGDPSSAPVWLPFQDTHVANLLGVWAARLACGPQSGCGDGARCEAGRCVRAPPQ
jgi:hypothetical protein